MTLLLRVPCTDSNPRGRGAWETRERFPAELARAARPEAGGGPPQAVRGVPPPIPVLTETNTRRAAKALRQLGGPTDNGIEASGRLVHSRRSTGKQAVLAHRQRGIPDSSHQLANNHSASQDYRRTLGLQSRHRNKLLKRQLAHLLNQYANIRKPQLMQMNKMRVVHSELMLHRYQRRHRATNCN